MAKFDVLLWRKRAVARYKSATARNPLSEEHFIKKLRSDHTNISRLSSVIGWCNHRKIDVDFTMTPELGIYDFNLKKIEINSRLTTERQLFLLLHECGHHLIDSADEQTRFSMGYSQLLNKDVNRTFDHRCSVLDEEFEAWHRGFRLSDRLNLHIDKMRYNKTRSEMIRGYMKWVLRVNEFGKVRLG
jgi:hypothetical protein